MERLPDHADILSIRLLRPKIPGQRRDLDVTPRHTTKKSDPFIAAPLQSFHPRDESRLRYWSDSFSLALLSINLRLDLSNPPKKLTTPLHYGGASHITSATRDYRAPSHHTMRLRTGNDLPHRARSFLSTCLRTICSGGSSPNRSEAYHSIPELSTSAQITPTPSRQSDPTPTRPTLPKQSYSFPIDPSTPRGLNKSSADSACPDQASYKCRAWIR